MTDRKVAIDPDYFGPGDGIYVIPCGDEGWTSLGFDVVMDRIDRYATELLLQDHPQPERGTMQAYEVMRGLQEALRMRYDLSGERAVSELSPQLTGLEGWRVEVVDRHGEKRRFIVGKSSGWMPCHLELKTRESSGGNAADKEYQSVKPVERIRFERT